MIEELYEKYDECVQYISHNEKKIAKENLLAIKSTILFLVLAVLVYFFASWSFKITTSLEAIFLLLLFELFIFFNAYKILSSKIEESFLKVRIFSCCFYTIIMLTIGYIENLRNPDMRSFMLPIGILVVSALYTDYFVTMTVYRLAISVAFAVMSVNMKTSKVAYLDIVTIIMAFLISTYCYYVVTINNSKRNEDTQIVEKKSVTDLLTGLFNKLSFEERSKEYLTDRVVGAKATLFIFDFDNFKHVNDNYGHQIGDEALKMFARILKDYFHPTDVIGRVGGDEFMALVMGEMPEGFINNRCRMIQHDLRTAKIGDASGFSCSIGICEDKNAHTFEELYKIADSALYEAKENGKACHVVKSG
ncbi:MAG: GGDEF domain-containing protein [Butyrivibrio sp.]|nr:GGDEF domain-containing protein [Butyrivibrio sp.]